MGAAMIWFSLVTLAANGFMLYLFKVWGLSFTDASEEEAPFAHEEGQGHAHDDQACYACEGAKEAELTTRQWIHAILHPGCNGRLCADVETILSSTDHAFVN